MPKQAVKPSAEKGLTRNQIIAELARSPHGKLQEYVPLATEASKSEPEFFAHFIAWNQINGQIRDSKIALPIISLKQMKDNAEFYSNSLAHIALLDPRNLVRAVRFAKEIDTKGCKHDIQRLVARYLHAKEDNYAKWEHAAVQHRHSMKELYALCHIKPCTFADNILFKNEKPKGSIFADIANLKNMSIEEAAGTIMERRIPFLIARGALGEKMKDANLVLALISRMSPTELVTNTKFLEGLGVKTVPALRAAYEEGLQKAARSKKTTLKATKAIESIQDETLKGKLQDLQEKQIKTLGGVDGNWLVLGDKSGSMQASIEISRHVAATLAKFVRGDVHLIFFDTQPRYINATGKTYDTLLAETSSISANGGTSIGCGVQYAIDRGLDIDGIAIISDGGDNTIPYFHVAYEKYAKKFDKEPTVYFYHTTGEYNALSTHCSNSNIDVQKFELGSTVDYYSLPNLVQTMRVNRYSLADQILETPLLDVNALLPVKEFSHV